MPCLITCALNWNLNARRVARPSAAVERRSREANITERFSGAIERWLDAGHGACILRRHDCAEIVAEALRYFDAQRALMISSVVMPNHVHAVFVQHPSWPLEKLLRSWKSLPHVK